MEDLYATPNMRNLIIHTHTHTHTQHAELTESFKNYLEGKGLGMVMGLQEAYWPVFGVLRKSGGGATL